MLVGMASLGSIETIFNKAIICVANVIAIAVDARPLATGSAPAGETQTHSCLA